MEGTSACVLVDEAGSCLSGGHVHVWWCILGRSHIVRIRSGVERGSEKKISE